jgi:hypothetical protein
MKIGLRRSGTYLGIDPGDPAHAVYTNRTAFGSWEEAELTQHGAWYDVRFLAANRQLCITPEGRLESRPAGAIGEWEQLQVVTAGGATVLGRAGVSLAVEGYQAGSPLVPLRISGRDFVDETGARRVLCGCDQFLAYRMFLDGVSLDPLIAESHALGFDTWRVFFMGSKAQNGLLQLSPSEPGYYDRVRPFALALNAAGITLLATVFVDAQDIMAQAGARQTHWREVATRLRGTTTLLSGGNEFHKNGFDPGELSDPGMLWSRGSDLGDAAPYRPYASFAEFHPRRDLPAALMDTVASPVFIYGQNGLNAPLIIDEPPRMGTDGSGAEYADPTMCYRFARIYSTMCAGAVFHSRPGQKGQTMDPGTRACADAWQAGMQLTAQAA